MECPITSIHENDFASVIGYFYDFELTEWTSFTRKPLSVINVGKVNHVDLSICDCENIISLLTVQVNKKAPLRRGAKSQKYRGVNWWYNSE